MCASSPPPTAIWARWPSDNSFREDLYYRLNVFPVLVPSLRDRTGDIAPLSRHFIERFAAEENKAVSGLTTQASQLLEKFNWPGNVRQLENTIFRAVVLCDGAAAGCVRFPADRCGHGRGHTWCARTPSRR